MRRELRSRRGFHHAHHAGRSFQQVGSADVADEDEVATGQCNEVLGAAAGVTNQIAQMLRCMSLACERPGTQ